MKNIIKVMGVGLMLVMGESVSADKCDDALYGEWSFFGAIPSSAALLSEEDLSEFNDVPDSIRVAGVEYDAKTVTLSGQQFDVGNFYYGDESIYDSSRCGNSVYLMKRVHCDEPVELVAGAGADWWMEWFVNGESVYDTMMSGNISHNFKCTDNPLHLSLKKGDNMICVLVRSGSGGWKFAASSDAKYKEKLLALEEIRKDAAAAARHAAEELQARADDSARMKIAVFGSSVAFGAGATNSFGWGNQLGKLLETENWTYVNKSVGGDNTIKILARIEKDLFEEKPDMVIIGLSLANEGVMGNSAEIYKQYVDNMRKIIQLCRKNNIIPIIANCYPNNSYSGKHYNYIRKFNELLNSWNVASIDFLGAVDDGQGHWQKDSWLDAGHPNDFGHAEMFYSISPSLFDNLVDWNYPIPDPQNIWFDMNIKKLSCFKYSPEYTMHSFSMFFSVISGDYKAGKNNIVASVDGINISVSDKGMWQVGIDKDESCSDVKYVVGENQISLTYSYVRSKVHLYINGKFVCSADYRFVPENFCFGNPNNDFISKMKDVLIYRSCADAETVEAITNGKWNRSSLELCVPLNDSVVDRNIPVVNKAQTGAELIPIY